MCFLKIKFFLFKINFFILLDRFDTLISEIIKKKNSTLIYFQIKIILIIKYLINSITETW
jgi:hypothetical protein